ncbi:MAG TPA: transposase domain-containing protein [Azospirillum sp.]|nr:transposase domain-containing protein [Azospirillum sp.]
MTADWEWLPAADMARLLDISPQAFNANVRRWEWRAPKRRWSRSNPDGVWRPAEGGGYAYHYRLLPARLQVSHQAQHQPAPEDPTADRRERKQAIARDEAWAFYERQPDKKKSAAKAKLAILLQIEEAVRGGMGKDDAAAMVGRQNGVGRSTIFGWYERVAGIARADWLPYLLDHRAGRQRSAETMPEGAWEIFKGDYLREEQPSYAECYNRLKDVAKAEGWRLPSCKTFQRRVEQDVDPRTLVLYRQGADALERLYPAQRRDKSVFHALEAVNYDGHKIDVFSLWPGQKKPSRTFLLGFQDIYSGMIVSWRLDQAETAYAFRLAFGDVIETWGIPDHVWSDNTMAAAAKENTGGSAGRYRFKIKEDDPVGLFGLVGSEIHFTKPRHGQAKPIERAFGTLSRYISKAPECAGAYTGNSPENKPSNYGERAIELAELVKVVEREIHRFNHDPALNSAGKGRSRAEVFAESYAKSPIRTAKGLADEQRRLWLLAAEGVTCRQPDGSVWLHENRYWHERLVGLIGKKVVLRFDPDRLHQPVHVYRLDGSFVCTAECIGDTGFADAEASKRHARAVGAWRKAGRTMAEAERTLGIDKVAALMPQPEAAPLPEAKVVRPLFGNLAVAAAPAAEARTDTQQETLTNFTRGMRALRLVSSND